MRSKTKLSQFLRVFLPTLSINLVATEGKMFENVIGQQNLSDNEKRSKNDMDLSNIVFSSAHYFGKLPYFLRNLLFKQFPI